MQKEEVLYQDLSWNNMELNNKLLDSCIFQLSSKCMNIVTTMNKESIMDLNLSYQGLANMVVQSYGRLDNLTPKETETVNLNLIAAIQIINTNKNFNYLVN